MSGVTSTIYFSIHGFKTLHSKGCSTFHRFLNDHRLQKTLLMNELRGGKLNVILSYDCFRQLSPTEGLVGAYISSRHIIAFLRRLCPLYNVRLSTFLVQTRYGVFPLFGWSWFFRWCLFGFFGSFVMIFTLLISDGLFFQINNSLSNFKYNGGVQLKQESQDSTQYIQYMETSRRLLNRNDWQFNSIYCQDMYCKVEVLVDSSNLNYFKQETQWQLMGFRVLDSISCHPTLIPKKFVCQAVLK